MDEVYNNSTNNPGELILPSEEAIEREALSGKTWPMSIWKISEREKPKFIRMASIFFLIVYLYSVLRATKDAVVSERQAPASIPFLKTFFVTPCSILFVFLIQKALQTKSVGAVLKYTNLIFGGYYMIYSMLLLPLQTNIEPNRFWALDLFGDGKMGIRGLNDVLAFLLTLNFWTSSLLYVTSELWGSLLLSLLFMSFSNDVCYFKQSIRFVPLFYIVSNIGLMFSGLTMLLLSHISENFSYSVNQYVFNGIFLLCGLACMVIYFIQKNLEEKILPYPICVVNIRESKARVKKKIGMVDGIKYMFKSKLLIRISFIVLAYNICTNLVDSVFKPAMKEYAKFYNLTVSASVMKTEAVNQILIAIIVVVLLCTPFSQIIQYMGWKFAGYITPTFSIFACLLINILAIYNTGTNGKNSLNILNKIFIGKSFNIKLEKNFGMIATSGLKIFKYAAFDIAKEALSMRISKDDRPMAKGIYDGICGRLGKTVGSIIIIIILRICGANDIREGAHCLFIFTFLLCTLWFYSVKYIGNKYNESIQRNKDIDLDFFDKNNNKCS